MFGAYSCVRAHRVLCVASYRWQGRISRATPPHAGASGSHSLRPILHNQRVRELNSPCGLARPFGHTATYTSRGTPLQSLECCFAGPNPYATRRSDPSLTIASRLGRFRARLRPPSTSRKSMREYFVRRARDAHLPQSSSLKRSYAGEDIGTAPATPSGLTQLLASLNRANRG